MFHISNCVPSLIAFSFGLWPCDLAEYIHMDTPPYFSMIVSLIILNLCLLLLCFAIKVTFKFNLLPSLHLPIISFTLRSFLERFHDECFRQLHFLILALILS